jgi:DNA/RNA-binding domain of Phe-tRNA-synthetase-like protein
MIKISEAIADCDVPIRLDLITGTVNVIENRQEIREMIETYIQEEFDPSVDPKSYSSIEGGRKLYRAFKKDPTRYRLSSEALMRRLKKERDIYEINDLVDLMNLFSLQTGHPVGLYDIKKIEGEILFRLGKAEEVYRGLGKGILNIENLPVLSDQRGAFGSATSDSERTAITVDTKDFLLVIFNYGLEEATETIEGARKMITKFIDANI